MSPTGITLEQGARVEPTWRVLMSGNMGVGINEEGTTLIGPRYDVTVWGAKGDDSTDNSTALIAVRDDITAENLDFAVIEFPPGTYRYTNNRWLWGLKGVAVVGYGASLKCTANKSFTRDNRPLKLRNAMEDYGDVDFPGDASAQQTAGKRIQAANRGDFTLTFVTGADAAGFAAGDWVLVNGFDQQQSGFPPNLRYFDYARVDSVNTGAGTITLDRPLAFDYDADWWDSGSLASGENYGKPRVLNLAVMAETVIVKGVTFLSNPNQPTHSNLIVEAIDVRYEDISTRDLNDFFVAQNRACVVEDSIIDSTLEPDKLVDFLAFRRCRISTDDGTLKSIANAVGCNFVLFEYCQVNYRSIQISPRRVEFRSCLMRNTRGASTMFGLLGNNFNIYPITSYTVENCNFVNSFAFENEGSARSVLADALPRTVVVDSVSGNDMLIAKAASKALNFLQNIDVGQVMVKDDGSKYGRVTAIVEHDASNIRVEGTWDAAPVAAETWYWLPIRSIRIQNNLYFGIVPYQAAINSFLTFGGDEHVVGEAVHVRVQNESMPWNSPGLHEWALFGYIKSAWIHVWRAYSGTSVNPRLRVTNLTPTLSYPAVVDLSQTGSRYVDSLQALGAVGSDTLTTGNCMVFDRQIRVEATHDSGTGLAGTIDQMPQATIVLEVIPVQVPRL